MKVFSHSKIILSLAGSRKLFFSLAFTLLGYLSYGQNINKVEYYFDTDPGFGNGTNVTVSPSPDLNNLSFNINSAALSNGFHNLFVRVRDDGGKWSLTSYRSFYKVVTTLAPVNLSKAEYFFDSDPGTGNGNALSFTNVSATDSLSFAVDISPLSEGFHNLFIRVKDMNGKWSLSQFRSFYKVKVQATEPNIVAAEYFFDNDPGFGSGTPIGLTAGIMIDPLSVSIDITSLTNGFHNLFVRVKDVNGKWSLSQQRSLFKVPTNPVEPDIVAAEYFFDTDPGFGAGTTIVLTPASNVDPLTVSIDITSLSSGYHAIFVRVKDVNGKWSLNTSASFYKVFTPIGLPNITRIEYFFDNDPGMGSGTAVSFTPGQNKFVNFNVSIGNLNKGFHQLFVRAKDSLGRWSLTSMRTFYKEIFSSEALKIKRVEYFFDHDPGFGHAVAVTLAADTSDLNLAWDIDIHALSQGFHTLHVRAKDERGKWSLSSFRPFYKQLFYDTLPRISKVEYFYDTDPGKGNGINVPVTPTQNLSFLTWVLNLNNVAYGQHQLFVRTKDEYGHWSLTSHDTIFYYLDSLPTASMNGPMGMCINTTAVFEINLTGTAPWTIIFNNGIKVDTVHNIMTTPYEYSVIPQTSGTKTAKVLKVMDAYYTGLYTGIPIDYEVYPLPDPSGTIYGPAHVCQGTNNVSYSVYGVANAQAYAWTVPPGATIIYQGYYWYNGSNYITVNFANNAQSGNISCRALNSCGYGASSSIAVSLHDVPEVEIGPDIFVGYNDTAYLASAATTGTPPYTYSWSPSWLFNNNTSANPMAFPPSNTNVSLTIADAYGCSATDQLLIYVGPPAGTTITGKLTYDNVNAWAISNGTVYLKQNNVIFSQKAADALGNYSFTGVPAGYYTLSAGSTHSWGGVNATDALLIMKHFAGIITLSGLKIPASDVNLSGNTNSIDALRCGQRFVGINNTFNAGDWCFESNYFYANVIGNLSINLKGLCYGDMDGTYNPASKEQASVNLLQNGMLEVPKFGSAEIPLSATQDMKTAAISLVLHIPAGITIESVRMMKGDNDNLVFNRFGNDLRIAWFSVEPIDIKAGENLLSLVCSYRNIPTSEWTVGEESKFADAEGRVIFPVGLTIPKLMESQLSFNLGENYPNPFSVSTTIPFTLPTDAHIRLSIMNLLGEELMLVADRDMKAGLHLLEVKANSLAPGIYQCRIVVQSNTMRYEQTRKLSVTR